MILKCLFFVNDKVSVYRQKENKLIPIKYKGDIFYNGDIQDILEWFEEKIGYIENESEFDICVIKNEEQEFDACFEDYTFVDKSSWSLSEIENFIENKNLKLVLNINNEYVDIINLPSKEVAITKESSMIEESLDDDGILAKYYRQKTLEITKK